jgi:hypothetical protein|eukprot:COSAG06_NODE_3046_length_5921_cov_23.094813_4_plen_108_part_00
MAGMDACACCPRGAGIYDVSFDESTGSCAVAGASSSSSSGGQGGGGGADSEMRPWTGRAIRDAEPVIFVICAVLACALLARVVSATSQPAIYLYLRSLVYVRACAWR